MRLHFFGGVSLHDRDITVRNFGTIRAAKLLALLALSRSGRMPRTHLAELLWPDDFYESTRLRLRQEIHRLKRALGDLSELINSDANDVWLERTELINDLDLLRSLIAGKDVTPEEHLFDNEFLPGWDEPWAYGERQQAGQLQIEAVIALGNKRLHQGDGASALEISQKLIVKHPLNEELRMVAVNAHSALGSVAAAVAEYQDLRRKVRAELGIELGDMPEPVVAPRTHQTPIPTWQDSVPQVLEPMFGRDELVDHVVGRSERVVSLIGPGGIGKTRLALECAQRHASFERRRVAFATLIDTDSPKSWSRTVLKQLREELPGDADPDKFLGRLLAQTPTLLVLDNVETILPDAAPAIAELVSTIPSLSILITSTVPTRIVGETIIPVGPIDPEKAGVEFLESALRALRPREIQAPGAREALLEISTRLAGYPLALRLASARLRLLSPSKLLEQLTVAISSSARTDLPDRHRSLDAALTSSLSTISAEHREALDQIAVLPGGLSMEVAALVFQDQNYLDAIESLLDLALVTLDEQVSPIRVRLLAPIRSYLLTAFASETKVELERRAVHSIWSLLAACKVAPWEPLSQATSDLLLSESENLAFAWHWSCEREPAWARESTASYVRFSLSRGLGPHLWRNWPHDVLAPTIHSNEDRIEFALAAGYLAHACDREDEAMPHLETAQLLLAESELTQWKARAELLSAMCLFRLDFNRALSPAQRALKLATESADVYLTARAHRLLGVYADFKNFSDDRIHHLTMAYEGLVKCQADAEVGTLGVKLGFHLWALGDTVRSQAILSHAKEVLETCKDPAALAYMSELEGRIALDDGRVEEAEQLVKRALNLWETVGSPFQEADQHHTLTRIYIAGERWEDAQEAILRAGELWHQDRNKGGICCSVALGAKLLVQTEHVELAKQFLGFSIDFEQEHDLVLVNQVISSRLELIESIGGVSPHGWPLTLDQARELFDVLRATWRR